MYKGEIHNKKKVKKETLNIKYSTMIDHVTEWFEIMQYD